MPASIQVDGLKEFRASLKEMHPRWPEAMKAAHETIATEAARDSRSAARLMGGVQAKSASAIGGKATQREARIAVLPSRLDAMAAVAFWGAKRRTGWYSPGRYRNSTRQHPVWVGNSWEVAVPGQGPYAINNTLARNLRRYLDRYFDEIQDLAAKAFPER